MELGLDKRDQQVGQLKATNREANVTRQTIQSEKIKEGSSSSEWEINGTDPSSPERKYEWEDEMKMLGSTAGWAWWSSS